MDDIIKNWKIPHLTSESSTHNQIATVIRKKEEERGEECNIDPEEVSVVLGLNCSDVTKGEVNDVLVKVLEELDADAEQDSK
jgi:hypothetical protein